MFKHTCIFLGLCSVLKHTNMITWVRFETTLHGLELKLVVPDAWSRLPSAFTEGE